MKTVHHIIPLVAASLLLINTAVAEEKDFGKAAPSESEVIQHFKAPAAESEPSAPASGDDYQDVSEGDLANVRGLKKITNLEKSVAKKPRPAHTPVEKAISMQILFDYDSANLTAEAKTNLDPVGRALASGELKGLKFKIEGHTDAVGSDDYNIDLSRRRADAVKHYLIDQYGLASSSIEIEGKGKSNLADAANPSSEANRRVRIISLGGN